MATESVPPSLPDKDPEHGLSSDRAFDPTQKPINEIPWGPAHPCFPHLNPHVPLSSPLRFTTRIIRVKRDWMIVGDLAPTFANTYPEIIEDWVSEVDFRELIENVNSRLIAAFHPGGWRAWLDTIMGLATGWIWEDLGFSAVKSGLRETEQWIERWNGRRTMADGQIEGAKVIPLRRTAYLSVCLWSRRSFALGANLYGCCSSIFSFQIMKRPRSQSPILGLLPQKNERQTTQCRPFKHSPDGHSQLLSSSR